MPIFNISVINQTFESHNEHDLPSADHAREEAIRGAMEIGSAEISVANPLFAAEVNIAQAGERLARYVLSIAVSPLR